MVFRAIVVVFVCLINLPTISQTTSAVGAQSAGMGGACAALTGIYSVFNNQAGISSLKKAGALVNYENRFLLPELGCKSLAVALPIKSGVIALALNSLGNKLYSENKYGLTFAKAFGEVLAVGIQLDYLSTRIADGYGTKGLATAELGMQMKPTKNLIIGAHVFNPARVKLASDYEERLPAIFKLGVAYLVSSKLTLLTDIVKDVGYKPDVKAGVEYKPNNSLYLRIGASSKPSQFSFGVGLLVKDFRLDIATSYHAVLGHSPQLGLVYLVK